MILAKIFPGMTVIEKYPYTLDDLKRDHSITKLPEILTKDFLDLFNIVEIEIPDSSTIEYDTDNCKLVPSNYPSYMDGKWILPYMLQELSKDEKDELLNKKTLINNIELKEKRSKEVDNIIITTVSGRTFDGDELSQSRMTKAVLVMTSTNTDKMMWKLNNNEFEEVTIDELKEALLLSSRKQTEIWLKYR